MPRPDPAGLAAHLAASGTRRSFLARVGAVVFAAVGGKMVAAAVAPEEAQAFHFCGHTFTTGSCPHPGKHPRIDRRGLPLRTSDGHPIDDLGRLVDRNGYPVDRHGNRRLGPDGAPLPRAPRTRICQDWVREQYHLDARLQGSWFRCCGGQIRKLWDCCAITNKRINGDAALHGYCYGRRKVFCVTFYDTGLPC
jgi:hypothetical protein